MKALKETRSTGCLLLIEGHRALANTLVIALEELGHAIDYASDGITGVRLFESNEYDAVIAEGILPGLDGLEVIRRIRSGCRPNVPLLIVSARSDLQDKINALDAGADDYLCKPFDLRELDARLKALVRRDRQEVTLSPITIGNLHFDPGKMAVNRAGRELRLSRIGLRLLGLLMRESPKVVTRVQLERHIWGDYPPESDTLRSHLYMLRKIIDRPFDRPLLHTLPHLGYRLCDMESLTS